MPETDKPSNQEEEYFAREEIEKKRKLALQQADELATQRKAELKQLHFMKCPKCGMDLQTLSKGKVEVDTCFSCQGIWLDAGELEAFMRGDGDKSPAVMNAVLNLFKKK